MLAHPKVDFLYFNAGGGHRAAATALSEVIASQKRPWDVRLVNLNEILLATDVLKKIFGLGLEDIYNLMLRKGWTLGSTQMLPLMHLLIRAFHEKEVDLISAFWKQQPPDMVVSLIPNFNRAVLQALRAVPSSAPFVTILTDIADYPPHFWIEKDQRQYVVCGSNKAVTQAKAAGLRPHAIFQTSGMILRPTFYDVPALDKSAARARLGLDPDLAAGLVLFGGYGSPQMARITRKLDQAGLDLQLILICGRNAGLETKLRAMKTRIPTRVIGFTNEVPQWMQAADFFIGKPGPGSISEALQMRLPVVVESNAWTMPQERYNAEWVRQRGVGVVLKSFRDIAPAVKEMLAPANWPGYRQRAAAIQNRAVFEVPEILENILAGRIPPA